MSTAALDNVARPAARRITEPPPAPGISPWTASAAPAVSLPVRAGESPADLRLRLLRAAGRLETLAGSTAVGRRRWLLRIDRPRGVAVVPLAPLSPGDGPDELARRLPDAALAGVTRLVLEAHVAPGLGRQRVPAVA